jgi:hypothetical protein
MPNPVTDPEVTDTPPADNDEGNSHLDAAKVFMKDDTPPADDKPADKKETSPAEPAKKPSILSQVLKTPEKKEPDKPAEPVVEDIAKGLQEPRKDSGSHAGWQELKKKGNEAVARAVAAERRAAELEAKLKTAPASEASNARIQELESQNKTFSERLKVLDLKSHPEFEEKYLKPQNAAKAQLEAIVKGDESDVKVNELLAMKGSGKAFNRAVSEALESLTPYARVQFQAALERYIAADIGAQEAVAHADEFLKSAKQNTGARSRAVFDQVSAGYRGHFLPAVVDEKADDAAKQAASVYNAALAEVSKTAEVLAFGAMDEQTAAQLANEAALYRFTMQYGMPRIDATVSAELATRDAHIQELEAQVKSLTAAAPKLDGGGGGVLPPENQGSDEDHLAAARKYMSASQS